MKKLLALTLTTALGAVAAPAFAQEKGDFLIGLGLGYVMPNDGTSSTLAGDIDVDPSISATITAEYFIADKIGIELLAASPFEHSVNLGGVGEIAEVNHLPPTLSVQYHFTNSSKVTPFLGAGINYTTFFDERGRGALSGADIDLDDSWGIALHAGADFAFNEKSAMRVDVRWINIETDATVDGTDIGKVDINPLIFGASYIMKF